MADSEVNALPSEATSLDGTEWMYVEQGGIAKKVKVSTVRVIDVVKSVTTQHNNSTVTPTSVPDMATSLTPGTYLVKVWMRMQSAATTTGMGVHLNASGGTVTSIAATWYTLTTGTAASAGVMDQASTVTLGTPTTSQLMEGRAQRANNVSGGQFMGVDTANADQFAVLEGIVIVTATTTLQVMLASEVASSQVSMMTGSTITITKVA